MGFSSYCDFFSRYQFICQFLCLGKFILTTIKRCYCKQFSWKKTLKGLFFVIFPRIEMKVAVKTLNKEIIANKRYTNGVLKDITHKIAERVFGKSWVRKKGWMLIMQNISRIQCLFMGFSLWQTAELKSLNIMLCLVNKLNIGKH